MKQVLDLTSAKRPSSSADSSSRAVLRSFSSGVQEGATPGTVDLLQLRAAETRIAQSWRTRLISLFIAKPCPQRTGFPAAEGDGPAVGIAAAAGIACSLIAIFVFGGAA